jgi:hypothetical protein
MTKLALTDEDRAWLESALDNWSHTTRIPASKMAEQVALHFLRAGIARGRLEGIEEERDALRELLRGLRIQLGESSRANDWLMVSNVSEAIRALLKE